MEDRVSRLFAGHLGVSAVLANILIDKRIVSREEVLSYFQQAHDAAARCPGGTEVAQALAAMISYLDGGKRSTERCRALPSSPATRCGPTRPRGLADVPGPRPQHTLHRSARWLSAMCARRTSGPGAGSRRRLLGG